MNGDDDLCVEKEEEDDKVQPVVKMRVKASRTSEVKLLLLGYELINNNNNNEKICIAQT